MECSKLENGNANDEIEEGEFFDDYGQFYFYFDLVFFI